jgi:arsenate reductase (glutaredoxin)
VKPTGTPGPAAQRWGWTSRPDAPIVAGMTKIYGIRNCDTMKKARAFLDGKGIAYGFHDYKAAGIERGRLEGWAHKVGWERLLNRAGTTFRKLPDRDKEGLDEAKAIALMIAQPSMIRRPVLEAGAMLLVGFKPEEYAKLR